MNESTPMGAVSTEMRIITAGRTGYENDLRRYDSIELIRARTAMDAIGELANPIDELSPAGTVILVGPDALAAGEEDEYVDAVHQITRDVKIVLISSSEGVGARFDAVLEPGTATSRMWNAIGIESTDESVLSEAMPPIPSAPNGRDVVGLVAETPASVGEPVEVHTRPHRPASPAADTGSAPEAAPRASIVFDPEDTLDEALLTVLRDDADDVEPPVSSIEAALTGADTLRSGLAELRKKLGTETVRFEPGETDGDGKRVQHGSRMFGRLLADGIDGPVLKRSASWLSRRLAVDAQLRELREAAFTDELTGAWNRRFFHRFLDRSIDGARSARQDLSLLFFDIDDFKTYNDRYGHAAGDEILVEVVRLLKAVVRPHDRVCRIGGDEFAVVFADGPREVSSRHPSSIEAIAMRFQRQICEHRFPKLGEDAMGTLTISGGLATFPWEAYDSASLIELADQLAMRSKRAGKNVMTMGPGADGLCSGLDPDADPEK